MFQQTTAQTKIAQLRNRVRIIQGGSSSSKTFSILPILIMYCLDNKNKLVSVVSESVPHLRRGVVRDFHKIMGYLGNSMENFNKTNLTHTFNTGSQLEFFSADQPDKLRGSRRDVLFINECNNVTFESYQQLAIRTREFIYLDFNPTNQFWVHNELQNEPDSDFIILTYLDNEALEQSIINEFEKAMKKAETSAYWRNWVNVYVYGQIGSLEGVIFNNWKQIDVIPPDAKYIGTGLDWGFTNDPTAATDVYKYNDQIILDEILYRKGMTNSQTANELKKDFKREVVADSAEPKSIYEVKSHGIMIQGADKGKDSINFGISIMQDQDFLVTRRSVNLIKELRNYSWDKNKQGDTLNN